jgi:DHA1 family tetracycline resistance protein-like MFS transporter
MASRKPALGFIFVTLLLDILGIGLIVPVLPRLIQEFQGGDIAAASQTTGWLTSLYSLMQFLFAPILGALSDRFGRRPVILGSLFGGGLDYILLALAPNLGWFYLGRMVAGISGASITAATAYIADVTPPEKRAAGFGLIGAAFGLGFIAGPALGGILGGFGLRVPFYAAAALTLLNGLYGVFVLPESLPPAHRRAFEWRRANPVTALKGLTRYRVVFGLTGTYFLVSLAHQVFPSTWVLYTAYRYHWTELQIGLSLSLVGLMAAIVQGGLTRRIIPALGEERAVRVGLAIAVVSLVAYGFATEGWMVYAIIFLGSLGGIAGPAVQGLISRGFGVQEQGSVQGSLTSLTSIAGIAGPAVATRLFAFFIGPSAPVQAPGAAFFFSSLLMLVALILATLSFKTPARKSGNAPTPTPV